MDPALRFIGRDAFGATPDTSFYFQSRSHREAFTSLIDAIECDRPFAALVGKPGTGKTTLLFRILEQYRNSARTAFIFQSQCNPCELLQYLLTDCDVDLPAQDIASMHAKFNEVLIETHRSGKRFLLLLDEAHNFDERTMESIRLLSDFETPKKKLVQIIFSGQPALDELLARPAMVQVRQRISLFRTLEPLRREEVSAYIAHRLKIVGAKQDLFSPVSLELIADLTGGIPREIHNVCFAALSLAGTMGRPKVSGDVVYTVARDLRILFCDERYQEETMCEGTPVVERVEDDERDEPQLASMAAAVSSAAGDAPPPSVAVPNVARADPKLDFFTVHRPLEPDPTDGSNHSFASNDDKSFAPSSNPDLLSHRRRNNASGKKIFMTAAALGILSGCAVFAWVQGVNGKLNGLVSAQTLFASMRTQPARSAEDTTQKPAVATMPRPPTKRRTVRQTVSDPTNGSMVRQIASERAKGRTDPLDPANRVKEIEASVDDIDLPAAATSINSGTSAHGVLAAAVMPSVPTSVAKAPAPAPISNFVLSKLIDSPRPTYPPAARNAGIWGEVELEAMIAKDGKLRDIHVVKGHPLLSAAAIKAAEKQRYTPYLLNGVPQEVSTRVRFVFKP